jgi:hypothetical protein
MCLTSSGGPRTCFHGAKGINKMQYVVQNDTAFWHYNTLARFAEQATMDATQAALVAAQASLLAAQAALVAQTESSTERALNDQRQIEWQQQQIDDLTGGTLDLALVAQDAALDADLAKLYEGECDWGRGWGGLNVGGRLNGSAPMCWREVGVLACWSVWRVW